MSESTGLVFCEKCGNLLDVPGDDDVLVCQPCGHRVDATAYENKVIVTKSHPAAFPSALRDKRSLVQHVTEKDMQNVSDQIIKEKCPKCGHDEMSFYTLQLRSADEGSTVFYECLKCGAKHSTNN